MLEAGGGAVRGAQAGAAPGQQFPGDTDPHLPSPWHSRVDAEIYSQWAAERGEGEGYC